MQDKLKILDVKFDKVTMDDTISIVKNYIVKDEGCHLIYTPNPEMVLEATKNQKFKEIIDNSDLNIPDGIGIVIASKILGSPLKERVTGIDMAYRFFEEFAGTDTTFYFFGAADGIAQLAAENMMKKYPGLKIIGTRSGYFNKNDEMKIIEEINKLKPDIILIGLGAPKQEMWMYNYKKELNAKVCMGIGGSFDVMSGRLKRAPEWMIKLNIEWLYRLVKQPTRYKRMMKLPLFILKVLFNKKGTQQKR